MQFKVRQSDNGVSDLEMKNYLEKLHDVERATKFHGDGFSEKEWITDIILHLNDVCRGLVKSYGLNSDRMTYNEVETWKRAYNEASMARNLNLRIFRNRFGEDFVFE